MFRGRREERRDFGGGECDGSHSAVEPAMCSQRSGSAPLRLGLVQPRRRHQYRVAVTPSDGSSSCAG